MPDADALHCVNHPKQETLIRCSKCDQPICPRCRVETPVGYRCRQCGIYRPVQYQVPWYLYVPAAVVGLPAGLLGGLVGPAVGFFSIFLGPVIGTLVGEVISRVTRGKRGVGLAGIAVTAILLGAFLGPPLLHRSLVDFMLRVASPWVWVYVFFAVPAAFWRLR